MLGIEVFVEKLKQGKKLPIVKGYTKISDREDALPSVSPQGDNAGSMLQFLGVFCGVQNQPDVPSQ